MKQYLPLIILVIAVFVSVNAFAQATIDIGASYNTPSGDFADAVDPGYGFGANVFAGLPMLPFQVGGRVAYNKFDAAEDFDGGEQTIVEIIPSIRYVLGPALSPVKVFGQFGVGAYMWKNEFTTINAITRAAMDSDDDGTDFGFCVGGGVRAKLGPLTGITAMPLYHIIMTEDENTSYLSLNVMLTF